jgi:hypothetical protein
MNLIFFCDELKIIIVISFLFFSFSLSKKNSSNYYSLERSSGSGPTIPYRVEINFAEEILRSCVTDISIRNLFD